MLRKEVAGWYAYSPFCLCSPEIKEVISADVERAYGGRANEPRLHARRRFIRNVLCNLASCFPEIGYVQGLHCLVRAAHEMSLNEPLAFCYLSYMLENLGAKELFLCELQLVKGLCYALEVYTFNNLPEVYEYLQEHEVSAEAFATGWFVTLFSEQLHLRALCKLWSLFLLKKWKILIKFGVAVLFAFRREILAQKPDEIHMFMRGLLGRVRGEQEQVVWGIVGSIKVTNRAVRFLSQNAHRLSHDSQICLWKLCIQDLPSKHLPTVFEGPLPTQTACCSGNITPTNYFPYCSNVE